MAIAAKGDRVLAGSNGRNGRLVLAGSYVNFGFVGSSVDLCFAGQSFKMVAM